MATIGYSTPYLDDVGPDHNLDFLDDMLTYLDSSDPS